MSGSKLRRYFDRIGYEGPATRSLETLAALQRRHALSVPFENLDVQLGRTLTTDVDAAFDKIVGERRGGWCYEQNGLFGWALAEIGFDVTRVAAAVDRASRGEVSHHNHLCLLVRTEDDPDRRLLADVGFGGSLLEPLRFEEYATDQAPFRVGLRRLADGHWQFHENDGSGEFTFDFADSAGDEAAMSRRCEYLQSHPESGFVRSLVAQQRTETEHWTLRGRIVTVVRPAGIEKSFVESEDEFLELLKSRFGLDEPEFRGLWPNVVERHEAFVREQEEAD